MRSKFSLTFEEARTVTSACLQAARQHEVAVSVAVVDESGTLLHFSRMNGARAYTVELASRKARTAASVGVPTGVIEAMSRERPGQAGEANVGPGGEYQSSIKSSVPVRSACPARSLKSTRALPGLELRY